MKIGIVIAPQNQGWILDRIGHEVGKAIKGHEVSYIYAAGGRLPECDSYFITHYSMISTFWDQLATKHTIVFFTHESMRIKYVLDKMKSCYKVVCESGEWKDRLEFLGLKNVVMIPEGADPTVFTPHTRSNGKVLISGAFYDRKNPIMLLDIIKRCKREFLLIGKNWENWQRFDELSSLNNFEYMNNLKYESYPETYSKCDVYLSCSKMEGGGPNSLIEAMHCNIVPVVSDTGNAREYITSGYNGYILRMDATADDYVNRIERAYKLSNNKNEPIHINETVNFYTWENFANEIAEYLSLNRVLAH